MDVFCSTIIPTINRSTLSRAVYSVLEQDFTESEFEVIVVNDSGEPLPVASWQQEQRVRVIDTPRLERSIARNAGAVIARGRYLHFLDDDDLLLPGGLEAFWKLHHEASDAAWLYGSYKTVNNEGKMIEEIHPEISGNIFALLVSSEAIPLQASLIRADHFFAAGGFDPFIIGVEDRDLGRRIALSGSVVYMATLVARIRIGEYGSTTRWPILIEDDRRTREKALSAQNALERLRESANSGYWRGRVCRAYLGSTAWNLRHKRILTAIGRFCASLAFANWHTLSTDFWRGLGTRIDCWPKT